MALDETTEVPVVFDGPDKVAEAYEQLYALIVKKSPLREVQRAYVTYVLARHGGNKQRASRDLEVDRRSIQRWSKGDKASRGREE